MRHPLRLGDWLVCGLLGVWAFVTFLGAGDDFSYDFGNYIAYFDRMRDLSLEDLWAQVQAFFPYPYVLVPPAGFFEIGFVGLVWGLLSAGLDGATTYATVGTVSLVLRVLLLRALGLRWLTIALATIYSVTLLEANAIRLGCALTATVGTFWAWRHGRWTAGAGLLLLAASFHLQSMAFTVPLAAAFACAPLMQRHLWWRALALAVTLAAALALVYAPGLADFGKLNEYAETTATSAGVNAASVSGLLALAFASALFLAGSGVADEQLRREQRLWSATHIAVLPALVLVLLATALGALGDRVWQFAFMGAVAALPLARGEAGAAGHGLRYTLYSGALHLSLAISVINVTVRYPLSNFFVPLLPHTPITPATLIVL